MCFIIYNNDRDGGGHGTIALPECAYAASPGAGLNLRCLVSKTRNSNQSKAPTVFFIKGVRIA